MTDTIPQTRIARIVGRLDPLDAACLVAMNNSVKTTAEMSHVHVRLENLGCIKRQFKGAPNAGDWILTELGDAVATQVEESVK